MWEEYVWIVVVGAFVCFFMAYGIGANDVANAFATSVGSKTLTLFQATCIAAVAEFSGALLLGRGVTDTVRTGILDGDLFTDKPAILMYAFLCALISAGIWLILATVFELPVSTTHSIIGGLVGAGLVGGGSEAVQWHEIDKDEKFPVKGISSVVISWVFSPVFSGIVAAFFFWITRTFILRASNSFDRAFIFLPVLVGICFFINAFYVFDKGISKQAAFFDDHIERSAWVAAIVGVATALLAIPVAMFLKKRVQARTDRIEEAARDAEKGVKPVKAEEEQTTSFFKRLQNAVNSNDPHSAYDTDAGTRDIHDNAEVFETRTEDSFRYLQVLTSIADSFAHGANDVANAVGPFAAIYGIYKSSAVTSKVETHEWILVIGGLGIVLGLATFGYHIIKAIGVKLCKITPSRGYTIELGSALVVVTGSYLGLPLSTTHCQVGATVAVGMVEGSKGVSWVILAKTVVGWVATLVVVGITSAIIMALGIFTPNLRSTQSITDIQMSAAAQSRALAESVPAACNLPAAQPAGERLSDYAAGVAEFNFANPSRVTDLVEQNTKYANAANACLACEAGEESAKAACNADVVKTFNSIVAGNEITNNPAEPEEED